jgi:hypothetical protein
MLGEMEGVSPGGEQGTMQSRSGSDGSIRRVLHFPA